MDPVTIAKLWMVVKPIKRIKEARQRRREKRMAEKVILTTPTGETIEHTPPAIPARTSTKVGVTGVVAGIPVIQWIQSIEFPWPWLESMTNSDMFVQVATLALAYIVARMSKSPLVSKAL
jgi:hypothetical protein